MPVALKDPRYAAETQDLGIRDLPDAQAQLIELQLLLEEVGSNVEGLQDKVRMRSGFLGCCRQVPELQGWND